MRRIGPQNANPTMIGKTAIFFLMLTVIVLFGTLGVVFLATPELKARPFEVPASFFLNTVFLIISSVLLHMGWSRRAELSGKKFITGSLLAGCVFLVMQAFAWYALYSSGITLAGKNPKMSYLYVLSGLHAAHLISGLFFIYYVLHGYEKPKPRKYLEIAVYFWHFLGVLWIYLLVLMLVA
ncbi:MAG: heme-copper oxidase subunit III [Bacteroidia bacterium]